jgi:ribose transport system substrate-binding protein
MFSKRQFCVGTGLLLAGFGATPVFADAAAEAAQEALAAQQVDSTRYKKPGPYKIGVSAGWLAASWVVFNRQYILWTADQHKSDVSSVVVTDAAFDPSKQVSDIEDLLRQKIDLLIYWAADEKAIAGALKRAVDGGVPTVNAFGGFSDSPGTTANAYISQFKLGELVAQHLLQSIGNQGKIIAILPIAGTQAAADQLDGLKAVIKGHPKVELLNVSYGDYNRAKSKQVTENLLQRYPIIDGVFCPSGNMSMGVVEAIEEAGRLAKIKMGPGDELNAWLKWVVAHKQAGAVTFPPTVGRVATEVGLKILKGEPVPRGTLIPSEYISPEDASKFVDIDRPDDSWAGPLPPEFLPK